MSLTGAGSAPTPVARMTYTNDGRIAQFAYDGSSHLTQTTDMSGNVTQFAYDGTGNLTSITDPDGVPTTFAYDTIHRVTGITVTTKFLNGTPVGPTETFAYSTGHTLLTDWNGNKTTYNYDGGNRVTSIVDALGKTSSVTYTTDNKIATSTDANGAQSQFTYDSLNNLTNVLLNTGVQASAAYTDSSHPYSITRLTDPQGNVTQYAYDTGNHLTKVTDALGNLTQFAYNSNGTLSSSTAPNGAVTTYQYDSHANLTGVFPVGPDYTYDYANRMATAVDGKNQTTTFTYDTMDRTKKVAYSDGTSVTSTFEGDGLLTTVVDGTGTTSYSYDPMGRVAHQTLPGGTVFNYSWDALGNLLQSNDPSGATSYAYSAVSELTSVTDAGGGKVTFTYDAARHRTGIAYPNGVTVALAVDSAGRTTAVTAKNGSGTTLLSRAYSYLNPANNQQTLQRYSVQDQAGNKVTYTYDNLNRLTGAITKNGGGTTTDSRSYTYDSVGNFLSKIINGTTSNYTYNASNRTMTVGSLTYTFDADGSLTSRSDGLSATYNAANFMSSATPPGGSAIGMTYTGVSQSKRVTAGTTSFAYDVLGLHQRTTGSSTTRELRDNAGALLEERTPGATYYVISDVLGSTIGLTDSTGALVGSWVYDPYDATISSTGSVSTPLLFGGGFLDQTGLYKIGARYYDPSSGRWIQQDLTAVDRAALRGVNSTLPDVVANDRTALTDLNRYAFDGDNPIGSAVPTGFVR